MVDSMYTSGQFTVEDGDTTVIPTGLQPTVDRSQFSADLYVETQGHDFEVDLRADMEHTDREFETNIMINEIQRNNLQLDISFSGHFDTETGELNIIVGDDRGDQTITGKFNFPGDMWTPELDRVKGIE
ncbi:hypothetical protein GCM10028857_05140 [Salinarchaeum chitinilyticum]